MISIKQELQRVAWNQLHFRQFYFEGTVMQIENALINSRLPGPKVS